MPSVPPNPARRRDALSKERILEAAIAILDADSAEAASPGLTLRALMTSLATGSGAIYHYVANMDELRAAAADEVLRPPLEDAPLDADPTAALRVIAAAIFDAIDAHPWLGAQLTRGALQPGALRIWKTIGLQLHRLGLTGTVLTDAGSALANFILGSAAQHTFGSQPPAHGADRTARLAMLADQWRSLDSDPLVDDIATRLSQHDDREQFLAGVDIILRGILAALRPRRAPGSDAGG